MTPTPVKLSLCIATFNRATYIGETLDSILPQLCDGVEVVILDGGSADDTATVVGAYVREQPRIRYCREETNSGVDADYDKAVGHARGEYCWLFPDDDLLAPGAVLRVLQLLEEGAPDLLVVDSEIRNVTLNQQLDERRLGFTGERWYGPPDRDRFLADAGNALSFIGCVIIRRGVWMARNRSAYYGSLFIHVGVIFQEPPIDRIAILGESLVQIRMGNAMWSPRSFEIWMFKWPDLIWGLAGYSDAAKAAVVARSPWRQARKILLGRASGAYGWPEYRRYFRERKAGAARLMLIASLLIPGKLAHLLTVTLLALRGNARSSGAYNLLVASRYSNRASRTVARLAGRTVDAGRT